MQLLELFHELTIRPQNAKELKGLVLQLALEGKFTSGKQFEYKTVAEVIQFTKNGFTGRPNDNEVGIPRFGIECVTQNDGIHINTAMAKFIDIVEEKKLKYFVKSGDVFICRQNGNLHFVGKAACYPGEDDKYIFSDSLIQLRPKEEVINSEFLVLSLSSVKVRHQLDEYCSTTAGNYSINGTNLKKVEISVPSLEEQKAIVTIVESLFKEVEQLEALTEERVQFKEDFATSALRQLIEGNTSQEWQQLQPQFATFFDNEVNIKKFRERILQLAVQGKLTANWRAENPKAEPASELLKRIQVEKEQLIKEKKIKKEKPLPTIDTDEISFEIPKSWSFAYLNDLGSTNVGLTYKPKDIDDSGIPVLRSSNIQSGKIDLNDLVLVTTDYREKDIIKNGDLLICARNGSRKLVGKCAILKDLEGVYLFGAFMAIFRSSFNEYVRLFIESPIYRSRLEGVSTTTINQITQGNLKSTIIPFPPIEEQKVIVEKVNQLMAYCDELEEQVKQSQTHAEQLMQSVLREVFEK